MKNWKYTYSSTPRQILKRNYVICGTNAYENFHNSNVHNDKTKTENLGRKQNALEKRMDNSIHLYNVELFCLEMKELQLYATLWIQLENIKRSEEMKHSAEGYVHKVCFLNSSVLACRIPWTEEPGGCSLWGHKVSATSERLNSNKMLRETEGCHLLPAYRDTGGTSTLSKFSYPKGSLAGIRQFISRHINIVKLTPGVCFGNIRSTGML